MKKFIAIVIITGLTLATCLSLMAQDRSMPEEEAIGSSSEVTVGALGQTTHQNVVGSPKIGYVDVARVFDEYSRTKKAKADLDKEIKLKQQTIRDMEKELRKLRKEFESQKEDLTEEEIRKKERLIEEKSNGIQIFTDAAEAELSEKEAKLTEEIVGEIYDAIYSLGKEENFSLIVDKSNVIYGDITLDLTDRLIKKLEAQK